jgi:hypothetical protein
MHLRSVVESIEKDGVTEEEETENAEGEEDNF